MTESQPRAHQHHRDTPRIWGRGALWLVMAVLFGEVLLYGLLSVMFGL